MADEAADAELDELDGATTGHFAEAAEVEALLAGLPAASDPAASAARVARACACARARASIVGV